MYSLAPHLPLAAYFERRLTGSDREGKVHLMLVLLELSSVPRTPADCLSRPGVKKMLFEPSLAFDASLLLSVSVNSAREKMRPFT